MLASARLPQRGGPDRLHLSAPRPRRHGTWLHGHGPEADIHLLPRGEYGLLDVQLDGPPAPLVRFNPQGTPGPTAVPAAGDYVGDGSSLVLRLPLAGYGNLLVGQLTQG